MDAENKRTDGFTMREAMKMAQSDPGRQLLALLKQTRGQELETAMAQASAGDYEQVKKTMSGLLSSPEVQALLKQMGG